MVSYALKVSVNGVICVFVAHFRSSELKVRKLAKESIATVHSLSTTLLFYKETHITCYSYLGSVLDYFIPALLPSV